MAIEIAVLRVAFTTLNNQVNTNPATTKATTEIINSSDIVLFDDIEIIGLPLFTSLLAAKFSVVRESLG